MSAPAVNKPICKLLGEGEHAKVYQVSKDRVIRVSKNPETDAWFHFGKFCKYNRGFHLPQVYDMDENKALIELLTPVKFDYKLPFSQWSGFVATAFSIRDNFGDSFKYDMNYHNFMLRGSLVVITDPLVLKDGEDTPTWAPEHFVWPVGSR